ncbi:hypothetical protein [Sphingobacterium sp. CZ-UAM]|uniref:hypothetical protein n=1 Tax=Sphingobacterium sp. CZ-UAM TaxID=1933868 RepID=UPI00158AA571|nr:hypothetical protein [Sphingobacterium sp. CZ-UAM]
MENTFDTLWYKLRELYNQGKEIELSLEESIIYGIDYSDERSFDDDSPFEQEEENNG